VANLGVAYGQCCCVCGDIVAYPLSLRNIEEMMQQRGVFVDHSTIHRWLQADTDGYDCCAAGSCNTRGNGSE
jgi:hypothetical protein